MNSQEQADEPAPQPAGGRGGAGEGWFALLGETLLTGILTLVGSLPVVTAPAALAAGAAHLRRHLGGYNTTVRAFVQDWLVAVRGLWTLGVLMPLAAFVVWVNTGLTASGALPGSPVVRWVTWVTAACAAVVVVRAAAAWSDRDPASETGSGVELGLGSGSAWQLLSRGAARSRDDVTGSVLLFAALAMCVVLVWMLTPLVLVTGGLLSLAAVAVETRRVGRL